MFVEIIYIINDGFLNLLNVDVVGATGDKLTFKSLFSVRSDYTEENNIPRRIKLSLNVSCKLSSRMKLLHWFKYLRFSSLIPDVTWSQIHSSKTACPNNATSIQSQNKDVTIFSLSSLICFKKKKKIMYLQLHSLPPEQMRPSLRN